MWMGAPICTQGTWWAGPSSAHPCLCFIAAVTSSDIILFSLTCEWESSAEEILSNTSFIWQMQRFSPVWVSLSQLQFEFMLWLAGWWVKFGTGAVVCWLLAEAQPLLLSCTGSFSTMTADLALTVGAGWVCFQDYLIKSQLHEHPRRESTELAQMQPIWTHSNKHLLSHHSDLFYCFYIGIPFLRQPYLLKMISLHEKCGTNALGQIYSWLCCLASSGDLSFCTALEGSGSWSKCRKTRS